MLAETQSVSAVLAPASRSVVPTIDRLRFLANELWLGLEARADFISSAPSEKKTLRTLAAAAAQITGCLGNTGAKRV
jgi:hypothetical protein